MEVEVVVEVVGAMGVVAVDAGVSCSEVVVALAEWVSERVDELVRG